MTHTQTAIELNPEKEATDFDNKNEKLQLINI